MTTVFFWLREFKEISFKTPLCSYTELITDIKRISMMSLQCAYSYVLRRPTYEITIMQATFAPFSAPHYFSKVDSQQGKEHKRLSVNVDTFVFD